MKGGLKMEKSVQITLIIVIGMVFLGLIGIFAVTTFLDGLNPQDVLRVNGQATVEAVPDLVTVYFNVETEGETSVEAKDANSEIVDDLIVGVLKLGFERKDIVTQNFNIRENCEWKNDQNVCDGYEAVHSVKVEMSTDESDKIGDVIDAGVDAGAMISYINFELSKDLQNEYKAEAMKLAAEDARIKADAVADGLDKDVGKLVSVSVDNFGYRPWMMYESVGGMEDSVSMAKEAVTNIQPGEREISASVSASFKLK